MRKKTIGKKATKELYENFFKRIEEIKKMNRKNSIENTIIPFLIEKELEINNTVLSPDKAKKRAIQMFENAIKNGLTDEFYNLKG